MTDTATYAESKKLVDLFYYLLCNHAKPVTGPACAIALWLEYSKVRLPGSSTLYLFLNRVRDALWAGVRHRTSNYPSSVSFRNQQIVNKVFHPEE